MRTLVLSDLHLGCGGDPGIFAGAHALVALLDAFGGDLAYQYGRSGSLAGIGVTPAIGILADPEFGRAAQVLTPLAGLQSGAQRLA